MPKAARYRLSWVDKHEIYVLHDADNQQQTFSAPPGSSAWPSLLRNIPSFTFNGKSGQLTVRQESRGGAGTYWYAYRRYGNRMLKRYLGRASDLTPAQLEEAALHLMASSPEQKFPVHDSAQGHDPMQGGYQASAYDPLLATKLHWPRLRTQLIPRSHLIERLQRGVADTLTLVSAPAGFGKTTLLTQWRATTSIPVAWLSLDLEDDEPVRFFTYLVAALQTLDPHLGTRTYARLCLPQPPELETVLALLINDLISWQGEDFVLVLDDYHVITAQPIHSALTYLVEHLPSHVHLILATRSDPPLPLARWRARGCLTELRAAELRFGVASTGAFLAQVMGLHLSPEDVMTLQSRTEGWIVGLQLAALSLQGRSDVTAALATFTGSHRFVLDYLSEEVLSRQPTAIQAFLLQTSVLERLSGSLCDAVTGKSGSQSRLEDLERANLFVVALDDRREWYRYHHLFADLLRSRLQQSESHLLPELHRRASMWYEEHDLHLEAIQYAMRASDLEHVNRLLEEHRHTLILRGQGRTLLSLLHALPDELIERHPGLCLSRVLLLMLTGQLPQALALLSITRQSASYITEERAAQIFLQRIAAMQAYILFFQGDLEGGVALAEQVCEHLDEMPVEV